MNREQRRAAAKAGTRSSPVTRRRIVTHSDPVAYAIAGLTPAPAVRVSALCDEVDGWLDAVRTGKGTPPDVLGLWGMAHMVRCLTELGTRGRLSYRIPDPDLFARCVLAIDSLTHGFEQRGRFVARAGDLRDLGDLVDVHRQLYEVALQVDLETAQRLMAAQVSSARLVPPVLALANYREPACK